MGARAARVDQKLSQVGEIDKTEEKNPVEGFEPTTFRLQILHLTHRLKLQSAITPVKSYAISQKCNQVIYLSSPTS